MKGCLLAILLILTDSYFVHAQKDVTSIIKEGIDLHDNGDFQGAIAKYDEALVLDPESYLAMYEKSYSFMQLKKYDEAEELLKTVLKKSQEKNLRVSCYVNYGTLLDFQGKAKKSVEIYDKGIKEYPDNYLLYFNKGITLNGMDDEDGALTNFISAAQRNPRHASSHHAIARTVLDNNRIVSIMALFTFLMLEPESERATQNLDLLNKLIVKGISQSENGSTIISIDKMLLDDKSKKRNKKKGNEEDFSSADFMLSLLGASAASVADSLGLKTEADKMSYKLQMLISVLDESKNNGVYSKIYLPFLKEMKRKEYVQAACHYIMIGSEDKEVVQWIVDNKQQVLEMLEWFDSYQWATGL